MSDRPGTGSGSDAGGAGRAPVPDRPPVGLIWAQTGDGVIGRAGTMPWHVPEDLAHFSATTRGHPVIMGRTTWLSFPERYRPLPGRTNIVLTRTPGFTAAGAVTAPDLPSALDVAAGSPGADRIWVLGGHAVFTEAEPLADLAVVTDLDLSVPDGDTTAPALGPDWQVDRREPDDGGWLASTGGTRYRFTWYRRQLRST